jgi:hypothetical protein
MAGAGFPRSRNNAEETFINAPPNSLLDAH